MLAPLLLFNPLNVCPSAPLLNPNPKLPPPPLEQQVTNVTNFSLKRRKDSMCVENRISEKWKNFIVI